MLLSEQQLVSMKVRHDCDQETELKEIFFCNHNKFNCGCQGISDAQAS